ncbi:uncharacterized protein LOC135248004 isoform X2 [Anguilla rostrata]|uniref:uncharacterized protein LOC135248004 isoform X2 n=1 Tax=Anguilla rostrata TaxID=7938 RepID=UPI0030D388AC
MKSLHLTVYMYLAVCNGGFPYNDYLDEVRNHLPSDYLFKIPQLDSTCNEKRDNYLQVKWTLGCIIQRDKDKNNSLFRNIALLFEKLNHCQDISKKSCHLGDHLHYVNVTQFQEKYSEAYEHQHENDYISCSCPSTSTAVTTKEILVTGFEPSTTSVQVKTQRKSGSTSNRFQSSATTDIPATRSRDITETVAVTRNITNLDSGLLLTSPLPFIFMGHKASEKAVFSTIVFMAIVIMCLTFAALCLWLKNRRLRNTQQNIALEQWTIEENQTQLL